MAVRRRLAWNDRFGSTPYGQERSDRRGPADEADQGFERQAGGHLTGVVAAHAVGDDVDLQVWFDGAGIFVIASDWACVGNGVGLDHREPACGGRSVSTTRR